MTSERPCVTPPARLLWVSWEEHRRSRALARALDADLHELIPREGHTWFNRYIVGGLDTVRLYRRHRPKTVICQHPSFVLALLTVLLRRVFGYRIGLDTHNAGFAIDPWLPWYLRRLAGWLQRRADFVIVHNEALKAVVANRGGRLTVLPDPLPTIRAIPPPVSLARPFNVLFICTFKADEPYTTVLEAVATLGPNIGIYITSAPPEAIRARAWPGNIILCGRLPWDRYDQLLRSVNGIIALTTREHCLLCGAHEAVAAGKPMLLSKTTVLLNYFRRGAVFTDNTTHSIRNAILELRAREDELRREVLLLREDLIRDWEIRAQELKAML